METPQELTDEQGEIVWCHYDYAWGGRYTHFYQEQSLNGCAILEHKLQPIRFQGQSLDVETGLHYNRFRYYDSDVGMFIQRDPIGLLGGVNVFAYAPNPVGWVDPWGLVAFKSQDWGNILAENYGVPKPHPSYHAHHIVFKGQWSHRPKIRQQLLRSRHILKKYGININSRANFMWAPNQGHSEKNAKAVADALSAEDKVVQALLKCKCISKAQAKTRMEKALQNIGHQIW